MIEKKNNDGVIKLLCYLGIFVLLIFIVLPPLFWNLFPEEENKTIDEPKKSIMNLNCVKKEDFVDYKIKTTIDTNYVEEKISNSTFTYEIEYTNELFNSEDIIIEEYETLKRLNNVDFKEEGNKRIVSIDYNNFDYSKEETLLPHQKLIVEQFTYYASEHFECKTTKIQ